MWTLLVDDHALMREGLALLMRQAFPQLQLLQAASLGEACICVGNQPGIELVLLDLNLRDSSGVDSVRRLRRAAPNARVVVLSADFDRDTVQQALAAGASDFIPKTARRGVIEQALRRALDGLIDLTSSGRPVAGTDVRPAAEPADAPTADGAPGAVPAQPNAWTQASPTLGGSGQRLAEAFAGLTPFNSGAGASTWRVNGAAASTMQAQAQAQMQTQTQTQTLMMSAEARLRQLGLAPRQVEVLRLLLEGEPNKVIARELDLAESTVKSHVIAIFRKLNVSSRAEAVAHASQNGLCRLLRRTGRGGEDSAAVPA
ncbi:MAG: hypothetical protein RIQ60_2964 [Pseudomonadota bacterium]|jgi:DNA-binding NarL/FixJ family response regulator